MTATEVEVVKCLVELQVILIERDVIETDTIIQFESVCHVPVILQVETNLVEANL